MASKYGIGTGVNFAADTSWSTTSGGSNDTTMPTTADDAFLDANSGAFTINTGSVCRSLNCTNYGNTLTHSNGVTLAIGDGTAGASNIALKLVSGMTYTLSGANNSPISFVSTSGTQQTIDFSTKTCGNFTLNGAGSSYLLSSALTVSSNGTLIITAGTINFNGQTISCGALSATGSGTRVITMGAADVTLSNTSGNALDLSGSNITFSGASSIMRITNTGASGKTFAGGGRTYGQLIISADGSQGAITLTGANTFSGWTIGAGGAISIVLPGSTNTTFSAAETGLGNGTNVVTFTASAGSATIACASNGMSWDYVNLTNIVASGATPFYAGANSTDGTGNTNWVFTAPPTDTSSMFNVF